MLHDSSKTKKYIAGPDLSNLMKKWKNGKTTNLSESINIPFESSKLQLDKVLMFIGLIGAG